MTASATSCTASSWPTIRWCRIWSRRSSFSRSPSVSRLTGIPVHRDTIRAISSAVTTSRSRRLPPCLAASCCSSARSRRSSSGSLPWRSQPRLAGRVGLLGQRGLLDLQPHHPAGQLVQLGRHRVDLGAQHRTGLVDEVDRLVRQEPVGDVAVAEGHGRHQRTVLDLHPMEPLEPLPQPAQDRDGVLFGRFFDEHRLEPALQRGVGLDALAVLHDRGRADRVQLAAGNRETRRAALAERADALIDRQEDDLEKDILTVAYLEHFFARQYTAEYLDVVRAWFQIDTNDLARAPLAPPATPAFQASGALSRAEEEYLLGGYARENYDLTYDRVIVDSLLPPISVEDALQKHAPEGLFVDDPLVLARMDLAQSKVTILRMSLDGDLDISFLHRLRANLEAVTQVGSRYWIMEYTIAASIPLVLADEPFGSDLLVEVQTACNEAGRPDRFIPVTETIEAWRRGNMEKFRHAFANLLPF